MAHLTWGSIFILIKSTCCFEGEFSFLLLSANACAICLLFMNFIISQKRRLPLDLLTASVHITSFSKSFLSKEVELSPQWISYNKKIIYLQGKISHILVFASLTVLVTPCTLIWSAFLVYLLSAKLTVSMRWCCSFSSQFELNLQ